MARQLRIQFEGAIYHVTVRGVERRKIFKDDADRKRFLECLELAAGGHGVRVYLFCLMSNHVHLLIETPQGNLSAFMHKLQTAYTVYYNLRHKRAGHLMQGRFGATPVEGDDYLLKLSRYIHLNPVHVGEVADQSLEGRVAELRRYLWSSYRGYSGLAKKYDFIDEMPILEMMEVPEKKRRREYRRFVEAGLAETDEEFLEVVKGSRWGIGSIEFLARMRDMHNDMVIHAKRPEDVSSRRVEGKVKPDRVVELVADAFGLKAADLGRRQYDCEARAMAAQMLVRYAGVSQRDIGGMLGMGTGSAVCRQLKRLRDRREGDSGLDARIMKIERSLEKR
jgi:REP element-mobilizing transposase RayT